MLNGRRFAFATLAAVAIALSSAVNATETSATAGPTKPLEKDLTVDSAVPSQPRVQYLAQAQCFSAINSCKSISPTQRCHATEHVIYTLQSGNWCRTPAPCSC